jgi:hypothetical protein
MGHKFKISLFSLNNVKLNLLQTATFLNPEKVFLKLINEIHEIQN